MPRLKICCRYLFCDLEIIEMQKVCESVMFLTFFYFVWNGMCVILNCLDGGVLPLIFLRENYFCSFSWDFFHGEP